MPTYPPLQACDILGTANPDLTGRLIRFFERAPQQPKPQVSHVGLIAASMPLIFAPVIEALATVRNRVMWDAYVKSKTPVRIWRPKTLTEGQKTRILAKANSYVGRKYGWIKIGAHAVDWLLSKLFSRDVYAARRVAGLDRYPICSWVVAQAYAAAGLYFGVEPGAAQPDDIDAYCASHPDKYELVWDLAPLI